MSVQAPAGVAEVVHTVAQHCSGVLQHSPHHLEYNMYSVQLLKSVQFISSTFHHSRGTPLETTGKMTKERAKE